MEPTVLNTLKDLQDLAKKAVGTELQTITRLRLNGDVPFIVYDNGRTVSGVGNIIDAFEKTQLAPYRRRGIYKAADVDSFLRWMEAHCSESAPVFGEGAENLATNWEAPKLALVGIGNYSLRDAGAWHDFGVRYDFPVTAAWSTWAAGDGDWMDQGEFGEFVDQHLYEFSEPKRGEELSEAVTRMIELRGGSKVIATLDKMNDLSNGIKLTVAEKVEIAIDRTSGETKMQFSEEHTGAGGRPVTVPKFFYIRVPIFFGEEPALIGSHLRYRNAGGGKVVWSYQLIAPDLIVKAAFDKACAAVSGVGRTLYLGTPDRQP